MKWLIIVTALTLLIVSCAPAPTPTPTPTAEPRSGLITLKFDAGVSVALSDALPFSPTSEIERTLRVIKDGENYRFTFLGSDRFYLRNTTDSPIVESGYSVTYGKGRLQLDRATYLRPVSFVVEVANTRLPLEEMLVAPSETVEVRLVPTGSIEELEQLVSLSDRLKRYYPTEEQIKELWEQGRRGWEDALGTLVTDEYGLSFRVVD